MRKLQITLFILGIAALGSQTLRHAYVKWVEPRTSVLERFQEKVESDISQTTSLQELVSLYERAHKAVQEFEKANPKKPGEYTRSDLEPYNTEAKLKRAIEEWEQRSKEIREVVFFFVAGIAFILLGIVASRRSAWIGMSLVILGFAEIIYWTSPSFRGFGAQLEFDRLLTIKLTLSALSWLGLIILWLLSERSTKARART